MFTSTLSASRALVPIAEHLFDEMLAFGKMSQAFAQLGQNDKLASDVLSNFAASRVGFLKAYLEALQSTVGLRFNQTGLPYCYTGLSWPADVPIAGYTGASVDPRPSEVLASLVALWHLGMVSKSSFSRLLRASLFIAHEHNLEHAIAYLVDLHQTGAAGISNSIAHVIQQLLTVRGKLQSDEEMIRHFFGGLLPQTQKEWLESEFAVTWDASDSVSDEGRKLLSALFERGIQEKETVRQAETYDAWLLGQFSMLGLLHAIKHVVEETTRELSLGIRAALSQWDEIVADAFSIILQPATRNVVPTFEQLIPYIGFVCQQYNSRFGDRGPDRFYQERLLVPARLRSYILQDRTQPVPTGWETMTWRLAYPYSSISRREHPVQLTRTKLFATSALLQFSNIKQILEHHDIKDRTIQEAVLEFKYKGNFRDLPDEESSRLTRALELMQAFKSAVSPPADGNIEPEAPADDLDARISKAHAQLCAREVLHKIKAAQALLDRGAARDAITQLDRLQTLYPWNGATFYELSVGYDESGDHETAMQYIIPGIVLGPEHAVKWHSLGVILNRLDEPEESKLAFAISKYLEARQNSAAPA